MSLQCGLTLVFSGFIMLQFLQASSAHLEILRDTLIESKGYWGYAQEKLELWRSNLHFDIDYVSRNTVKLMFSENELVGFYAIVRGPVDELDHLWLLPKAIGKGFGNAAFNNILRECHFLGISEFYIVSDPDAEGFYLKRGAVRVGEVFSEPQNRMLPRLKYVIGSH